MNKLSRADLIWNRAFEGGGDNPRSGDEKLAALLLFHTATYQYGVPYAIGYLDKIDIFNAKVGYRYFKLKSAAKLILQIEKMTQDELIHNDLMLNTQYKQIIPDFDYLDKVFKDYLSANPFEFAPL